jgi:methylated-DNA-protein-cysteine methyltransferase related protein
MASPSPERRKRTEMLTLVRGIPPGWVVTVDGLAKQLGVIATVVVTLLGNLSEDEREATPWHRVVAKGGAIGRGPHRDQQFAKLVREGVLVSPAGVVQDLARVAIKDLEALPSGVAKHPEVAKPPAPLSRSRGMKDRPG